MPPPGQSGFSGKSGYSGYSGKSGYSGFSGYSGHSGAPGSGFSGPITISPTGDIATPGTLNTGSGTNAGGQISLCGSVSGVAHLTVEGEAGSAIFKLPSTSGTHTLATLADLEALYLKLTGGI